MFLTAQTGGKFKWGAARFPWDETPLRGSGPEFINGSLQPNERTQGGPESALLGLAGRRT